MTRGPKHTLTWLALCAAGATACGGGGRAPDAGDAAPITDVPGDLGVDVFTPGDASDVSPSDAPDGGGPLVAAAHSGSIAISPDGARLYVVNADADSVSVLDARGLSLVREIPLGARAPGVDPATGRFDPAVGPRALALAPRAGLLYVTGSRSGELIVVDLATNAVAARISVGSEPVGVLLAPDERSVYVACAQDATVVRVDTATRAVTATAHTPWKPWALAWTADGATLLASHLLGPGVSAIDPAAMTVRATWQVPDTRPTGDVRVANGEVRGLYDLAQRPGTNELWSVHLLLATATAQTPAPGTAPNALRFDTTVFPAVSIQGVGDGALAARLTTVASDPAAPRTGQFGDIVSGPHALAFTADGRFALVADTQSDDVLVIDAARRVESNVVRRLPGHMPEGIVIAPDGARAFVDERNSSEVAVLDLVRTPDGALAVAVATDTNGTALRIARVASDPMPALLREGQRVFYSANSDQLPITQNHWVACASCHIEARSDAVVWRFASGPRDTPSNAGGTLHTGFLHHTADRIAVRDYWRTIRVEQGGTVTAADDAVLEPLQAFVNLAIPYPPPPRTDPARVARGGAIFHRDAVGCAGCHSGEYFTDSGTGNAGLDLGGLVVLHNVGTCNFGEFPDVPHEDDLEHPREPCSFDTPSLRGVADSAPYFHDGSAATLRETLTLTRGRMGNIDGLSDAELDDLVEYLRSL